MLFPMRFLSRFKGRSLFASVRPKLHSKRGLPLIGNRLSSLFFFLFSLLMLLITGTCMNNDYGTAVVAASSV